MVQRGHREIPMARTKRRRTDGPGLQGAAIEQVEKLRAAMKAYLQAYIDRMESKMAKAVNLTEIDARPQGNVG